MHVERLALGLDAQSKRHPSVCRDPDPGDRLDFRVRGNDHHAMTWYVCTPEYITRSKGYYC
jgi:hypothetical protein